jgi:glucosamine-6-phosphate deaminase
VEVVIVPDAKTGGALVGAAIQALLDSRPTGVIGVATGSTPSPVYQDLIARHRAGTLSFAQAHFCQLDEYVGLPSGHPSSYRAVIKQEITSQLDIPPGAVIGPDGNSGDLGQTCRDYELALSDLGGVDIQILGIGTDGHIGFNEPVSSLGSRTRMKTLAAQTRLDNARFFAGDVDAVPRHVLTQGIGTILEARHVVMLAWGESKASAVARCIEGPVTAMVPASALQLHPHVSVVIDESAASGLELADYYRETWALKPAWQGL